MSIYLRASHIIKVSYLFLLTFLAVGCAIADSPRTTDVDNQTAKPQLVPKKLAYGNVMLQELSEYVIIPVGYMVERGKKLSIISSNSEQYALRSQIYGFKDIIATNLIFHHKNNNDTHLLLNKKALIDQLDYLNPNFSGDRGVASCKSEDKNNLFSQFFIYKIIEWDTNQNGKLDRDDGDRGYISELSGKNLRSITPENTKLTQWECDLKRNKIILFVREDFDNNNRYTSKDSLAGYLYDLSNHKLQRITPEQTSLIKWKIDFSGGLIFLEIKTDSNKDRQFTKQDEANIIKFAINGSQAPIDLIPAKINSQLKFLNSN